MTAAEHAELSLLSALLLEPALLDEQAAILVPEDFTGQRSMIFAGMQKAHSEGLPLDLPVLRANIAHTVPDDVIAGMIDYTATTANVEHHIKMVRSESLRRVIGEAGQQIVRMAADPEVTSDDILDNAETIILDIGKNRDKKSSGPVPISSYVFPALDLIDAASKRGQDGEILGLTSGIRDLDKMTGGFLPGQLILIAARPGCGKSSLGMNIIEHLAEQGKRSLFFSLEMTGPEITVRLVASRAGVDSKSLRLGFLSTQDHARMLTAAGEVEKMPIHIDDQGGVRLSEIRARTRRLFAKSGVDLVVVDYIQLVKPDAKSRDRRDLELGEISAGLKNLAKELSVPVIALAQLNRGPEQRDPDKRRPMMADLRDSGNLEQDADAILFLYRDHMYDPKADPNEAEIIIGKQRSGPTGIVPVGWNGKLARFTQAPRRSAKTYDDPEVL